MSRHTYRQANLPDQKFTAVELAKLVTLAHIHEQHDPDAILCRKTEPHLTKVGDEQRVTLYGMFSSHSDRRHRQFNCLCILKLSSSGCWEVKAPKLTLIDRPLTPQPVAARRQVVSFFPAQLLGN